MAGRVPIQIFSVESEVQGFCLVGSVCIGNYAFFGASIMGSPRATVCVLIYTIQRKRVGLACERGAWPC